MSLYSLSIRRPVLATVFALVITIFGAVGFYFLGVREYPAVDPPVISVTTEYRGANADVIDSQITEPLEEQINGIDGIRTMNSSAPPTTSATASAAPGACSRPTPSPPPCRSPTPTRRRSSS